MFSRRPFRLACRLGLVEEAGADLASALAELNKPLAIAPVIAARCVSPGKFALQMSSRIRAALASAAFLAAALSAWPLSAEIIPAVEMARGKSVTQQQCAADTSAVWVSSFGRNFCMRYYLSTSGGEGTHAVVFLNGDADWKRDPTTHLFVLDEKQKTEVRGTNDWVRFAERISKDTNLPDAEPTSEPESMHFPASMRRRYEKLDRFPEAYLVFGDAIASFNPIYGQGMSVAALESEELAAVLVQGSGELLGPRFFRRAAKIVDMPWAISVGNDLRMPETIGPRNIGVNFINWYMSKLHKTAHTDPIAALAFFRVANLLAPPPSVSVPQAEMKHALQCRRQRG